MTKQPYATPAAFKQSLENRLKGRATTGDPLERIRQLVVFDRFLARLNSVAGDAVILKGGLVLEVRLARARTTKDIDVRLTGSADDVLDRLQQAGRLDLSDFMQFEVQTDPHHPDLRAAGMKYDGLRYRAECRLAGKIYGRPFGVDVAFGDPLVGAPDLVKADDVLAFAGIEPPMLRLYPVVSHIAEKLHAYTLPRTKPNSRIKDLPDLALLATVGPLDARALRTALERTLSYRDTHALPSALPAPPAFWREPYAGMVSVDDLQWPDIDEVHRAAAAFLDPALSGKLTGNWDPAAWNWSRDKRDP